MTSPSATTSQAGFRYEPFNSTMAVGQAQQFDAAVIWPAGTSAMLSTAVIWSVSGQGCSGAGCGTMDPSGKYTAPSAIPTPPSVAVKATSVANPAISDTQMIAIVAAAGEGFTFAVSPTGVDFGNQAVNTMSGSRTITLTNTSNTGGTPQRVFVRIDGPPGTWQNFAQTNNCPATVAVGASCTLTITFTPSATGTRAATLIVDGIFDEEAFVNLTGVGTN